MNKLLYAVLALAAAPVALAQTQGVTDDEIVLGTAQDLSGPIVSLMDMAASLSLWIKLGRFRHQATLDLRIDYLRPARPGAAIVGRGECYGVTRSIGFTRGIAHDGDPADPVAHVSATFMFTG